MTTPPMHSLLRRQLKRYLGEEVSATGPWGGFIEAVDAAYQSFDLDRQMLERSLDLSSQELLQANSEIRAVFQAIPDLLLRIDCDGTILAFKAGVRDDLLLQGLELTGKKIQNIPQPEVGARFRDAIARVVATRTVVTIEYSLTVGTREHDYEARLAPVLEGQIVVIVRNITDRKRAELTLVANEERYRLLFEHSPMPKWVYDLETLRIVDVNEAAQAHYGYSREEFLALTIRDIRPPEEVAALDAHLALAQDRPSAPGEWKHRKKDGTIIDVLVYAHDINVGMQRARMVVAQDITSRKRVEQALREAEEKYRSIFENAMEGIYRSTPDGKLLAANPAVARIFGYVSPEDLIRERTDLAHQGYVDPRKRDEFKRLIEEHGMVSGFEYAARHKDGSEVWVSENARVMRDAQGVVLYYDGTLEDISARKRAEEALREARRQLERVLSRSPTIVYSLSVTGQTVTPVYLSENLKLMLGYDPAEALRPNWWREHIHPADERRVTADQTRLFDEGHGTYDYRFRHKNGSYRWLRDEQRLLHDAESRSAEIVGSLTDVTERVELEAQLRQAQKMEAVGQLAGGVAHDFNNLLTVIKGYSQLLLTENLPAQESRELLREVFEAATRAGRLTHQLLAFSRKQAIQLQNLDLNEVVAQLGKMLQRVIGEDVTLKLDCPPDVPRVQADAGMLEQVLLNLALNARDAMPEGGQLLISTGRTRLTGDAHLEHASVRPGEYATLRVRDTGCGMSPETTTHIFEPFFTTKDPGKGTGLGLATAYGIVQQHQGWIDVESEIGKGSTFTVFLPAAATGARLAEGKPESTPMRVGTETVLLVEDEPAVRHLARMVLQRAGYQVLEAGSTPSALAVWQKHRATIALLVTDIILPDGPSGCHLAQTLQTERPGLKVVYTSGYSAAAAKQGVTLQPGVNFLQKPYLANALTQIVRDRLDGPRG